MEQKKCVWFKQGFCKVNSCQGKMCDLYDLEFNSKAIQERMKDEVDFLKRHKFDRKFKDISKDKIMGLHVLNKGLKRAKRLGFDKNKSKKVIK